MKGTRAVPDVRFLQPRRAGLRSRGRQPDAHGQRAGRARDPRQPAALFRLADLPQLFINGELIGGCDITVELAESGELARLVADARRRREHRRRTLQDRVVLVVGAAGGLGAAASVACAAAGATVVLLGRKPALLNRVYDAAKAVGPEPALYPLDLEGASPDDFDELRAAPGDGIRPPRRRAPLRRRVQGPDPLQHTDPADFARAIHVDLTARWWLTQACLPLLSRSDAGAVVFAIDDPVRVGGAGALLGRVWPRPGKRRPRWCRCCRPSWARTARASAAPPGPDAHCLPRAPSSEHRLGEARAPETMRACVELLSSAAADACGRVVEID